MGLSLYSKKAMLSLKISEFEMPPMQDLLIIGRKAPIGPEAVRRMAEALSPEQYIIVPTDHSKVEAILVRTALAEMMDQETLVNIVLEEAEGVFNDSMVLRSEVKIEIAVQREVDLK